MCIFIMKTVTRKKILTVQANTAEEFDREFNEASESLGYSVELKWDAAPMCVHFIYEETDKIPETCEDEFELQGIKYYCKDCPNMLKGKNRREKSHGCKYAEFGTVKDFTPACEYFYRQVLQGKITPEVE